MTKIFASSRFWIYVYLVFPIFIFLYFWLRQPYSLILALLLLWVSWIYFHQIIDENIRLFFRKTTAIQLFFILLLILTLTTISGAGGFVVQSGDWTKHNVVINDLMNYEWPVNYGPGPYVKDTTLVYYLAYYIPPALIGKVGGWRMAEIASYIYTLLGVFLFVVHILPIFKMRVRFIYLLLLLGGLDVIGSTLIHGLPIDFMHLDTFVRGLQVPTFVSQIFWAPQHALSAWLFFALLYEDAKRGLVSKNSLLYFGLSLMWSPFVAAGILIMAVPLVFPLRIDLEKILFWTTGSIISLVTLLYFKSVTNILGDHFTFYWYSNIALEQKLWQMAVFIFVDILIFVPFVIFIWKKLDIIDKKVVTWSILSLIIVSQFSFGASNDWLIRTSPLLLLALCVSIAKQYNYLWSRSSISRAYFIIIILISVITPLSQIANISRISNPATNQRPDRNMMRAHLKYGVIHQQYMGSASRLFGKLIGNYDLSNK